MKRLHVLALVALAASSSAFADDVDSLPNGYVSSLVREAMSRPYAQSGVSVGDVGVTGTAAHASVTRAQVKAETKEASRLGLLSVGEGDAIQATPEQNRQIEQAGRRALSVDTAAVR